MCVCVSGNILKFSSLSAGEVTEDSSNGDSIIDWLNSVRQTGNTTRSGQRGNQSWRAVSRTNPNSGDFRFSLEINVNRSSVNQNLPPSEQPEGSGVENMELANQVEAEPEPRWQLSLKLWQQEKLLWRSLLLKEVREEQEAEAQSCEGSGQAPSRRVNPNSSQTVDVSPVEAEGSSRTRQVTAYITNSVPETQGSFRTRQHVTSRQQALVADPPTPSTVVSNSGTISPQPPLAETSDNADATGNSQRPPTIVLDLQVRRIRPGEYHLRDSIANRTRSRSQTPNNTITYESEREDSDALSQGPNVLALGHTSVLSEFQSVEY
uniref:E3 ubiquitin-protein ligase n=1 Tax=Pyxicephalus adspersus TaxID=30357 RepID=A0A499QU48_PYXAD|nr:E3 ubiquitin-protein ligase [Pyxicephalus adspersus]